MRIRTLLAAASLALGTALASPARAHEDEFERGPHAFLHENELELAGGIAHASDFGGTRANVSYGYELSGGLWLDLRIGWMQAKSGPGSVAPGCSCARLDTMDDVLAGVQYKLRTSIPLTPYAKASVGLVFLFPEGVDRTAGVAGRVAIGAKYFLYDWLGFGVELGALAARTGLSAHTAAGDASQLPSSFLLGEIIAGTTVQF